MNNKCFKVKQQGKIQRAGIIKDFMHMREDILLNTKQIKCIWNNRIFVHILIFLILPFFCCFFFVSYITCYYLFGFFLLPYLLKKNTVCHSTFSYNIMYLHVYVQHNEWINLLLLLLYMCLLSPCADKEHKHAWWDCHKFKHLNKTRLKDVLVP